MCLILSMAFSLPVNAEELSSTPEEIDSSAPSMMLSNSMTDSSNNRYSVTGDSLMLGKNATVKTSFQVTYYYSGTTAGKAVVDGYSKSVKAYASISLAGGGANSLGGTTSLSGASGTYSPSVNYLYVVTRVIGQHSFTCNGKSVSFSTICTS